MLEHVKYVNHKNEVVEFGENGLLVSKNDLRDFAWNFNSQYSKITSFTKSTTKKSLPFIVTGGNAVANRLFEILEKDVLAGIAGKLYVGDYYIKGFFYGSTKSDYLQNDLIKGTLQFVTDQDAWIKAVPYVYRLLDQANQEGYGYDYDFPYDYTSSVNTQNLINSSFVPANFIINIYGAVADPVLTIAGHPYHVAEELLRNEYLTINSYDKTIVKTTYRGEKVNVFAKRDLDNYIFEKIPVGESKIIMQSEFDYDVTLLLERSEPEWI